MLAFRGIARSVDERTMIPCILPLVGVGNSLFLCDLNDETNASVLLAVFASFAFDYCARQKTSGANMNFFVIKQLPAPSPQMMLQKCPWDLSTSIADWCLTRVEELTATASDIALSVFPWNSVRRFELQAELDAGFFHLYGIGRDDVNYVMGTFDIVQRKDIAQYGSYRTNELILDIYDRMTRSIETGEPYQTILDPPPGDPSLRHPMDLEA